MTRAKLSKGYDILHQIDELKYTRERVEKNGCSDGCGYAMHDKVKEAAKNAALATIDSMLGPLEKQFAEL